MGSTITDVGVAKDRTGELRTFQRAAWAVFKIYVLSKC